MEDIELFGKLIISLLCICNITLTAEAKGPSGATYTNSLGMKFVRIERGSFEMGFEDKTLSKEVLSSASVFATGDFDEHPKHSVKITKPFYMGIFEVTNYQYELFDVLVYRLV